MSLNKSPELITLQSYKGDWKTYVDVIYQIYLNEVVNGKLTFENLPIRCQYRPATHGKHFGFWHLISEGKTEDDRTPDLRRCERIRWIAYIIKNINLPEISYWENKRGNNKHVVLWLEKENFIVILAKRHDYFLLKTIYVHNNKKTEKLRKERDSHYQKG